jgi:hypothetical protein
LPVNCQLLPIISMATRQEGRFKYRSVCGRCSGLP